MMKEPLASRRFLSALKSLRRLSMNCLKCGEGELVVESGELVDSTDWRPVLEEQISASTSRSKTTTCQNRDQGDSGKIRRN